MIAFNMKIFVNIAEIRVERINKIPTVVGPMPNVINTMLKE